MAEDRSNAVLDAVKVFAEGGIVLVMDDFDRENECDMIALGETLTKEQMAFIIRETTGIVCVVAEKERLESFGLYPAARSNSDKNATNFYVATDYLPTTTTGVSAHDRVETVKAMCRADSRAEDFSKPGHMFPLCPRAGGVLERGGHTESAYDLCRLAGKTRVSVIGELMRPDGEMMRLEDSKALAEKYGLPLISVAELKEHMRTFEVNEEASDTVSEGPKVDGETPNPRAVASSVKAASECTIPILTSRGPPAFHDIKLFNFEDQLAIGIPCQVVAAIKGDVHGKSDVPVRIHSECFTGDVLRSAKCDCGLQLNNFFSVLESSERGVLLYVRGHEGRGIGLGAKMNAYSLQDGAEKLDTVDANTRLGFAPDLRTYTECAEVCVSLGLKSVRLYTNNPEKVADVQKVLPCVQMPCKTVALPTNKGYLSTKEKRMGHLRTTLAEAELQGNSDEEVEAPHPSLKTMIEWPKFGEYAGLTISVVYTAWNAECVSRIVQGCEDVLTNAKCHIVRTEVPDALDLVAGAQAAKDKHKPDAIICVGIFVQGSTESSNDRFQATVAALQSMNASGSGPIICGVLSCKTDEQAQERSQQRLGGEWAKSALQMVNVSSR
jgi:3,4-dihydroxy 2-butanone 4-phosphate synthase/GTP cyclohydrolase II